MVNHFIYVSYYLKIIDIIIIIQLLLKLLNYIHPLYFVPGNAITIKQHYFGVLNV